MARDQEVPFDVKELERMVGREFYLAVMHPDSRVARDFEKCKEGGVLMEVLSRRPQNLEGYMLGNLSKIMFEDGTLVGATLKDGEVYKDYIFTLENVEIQEGQPPILRGQAAEYRLHSNSVGEPLGKRLALSLERVPKTKEKGGILCA